jgi:hypothetical protein
MKIFRPVAVAGAALGSGFLLTTSHYQKPNANPPKTNSDMISNGNSPVKPRVPEGKCFLETSITVSTAKPIKTMFLETPTKNDCAEAADLKRQADITTFCNPSTANTANEDNSRPNIEIIARLNEGESLKSTVYFQPPGSQRKEFMSQTIIQCPSSSR